MEKYTPNLIIGSSAETYLLANDLVKKNGEDSVLLMVSNKESWNNLTFPGPLLLRGEENVSLVHKLLPNYELDQQKEPPYFYKDQKFSSFKGRRTPQKLFDGESFFTEQAYHFDYKCLTDDSPEEIMERVDKVITKNWPMAINKIGNSSGEKHWEVVTLDGQKFTCKNLLTCLTPGQVYDLVKSNNDLGKDVHNYGKKSNHEHCVVFTFDSENKISDLEGTVFLPQSCGQEQGHFIGEFADHNDVRKNTFMLFVKNGELSQVEISKKVKLLKRTIKRIFPKMKDRIVREKVYYLHSQVPCLAVPDKLYHKTESFWPHLFFIGNSAPFRSEFINKHLSDVNLDKINNQARSVASYFQAQEALFS